MLTAKSFKIYSSLKQKKYREIENKFLIEGIHLVEECLHSDYQIECIIISQELFKSDISTKSEIISKKIPVYFIKKNQYNKLAETEKSQGILAIVNKPAPRIINFENMKLAIALDKINDPGNLGTIIRTAYWFNIDSIIISSNSVDLYNPKVIRSTQGAIFHVNVYTEIDLPEELLSFQKNGFKVILFDLQSEKELNNNLFEEKNIFVFGNESTGISNEILHMGFERVKIKSYSDCESLNLAVSCGIALNFFRMSY